MSKDDMDIEEPEMKKLRSIKENVMGQKPQNQKQIKR